jgi:glycosyltransferase involved in cell wall biosynthesis
MPTIRGLRYRLAEALKKTATHVFTVPGGEILDIGAERLGNRAPRALIIYTLQAIPYYVAGDVRKCPILNEHTMYWESAEMVRQLNEAGYVVDYYDINSKATINWDRYSLVIDERNHLSSIPASRRAGLTKIYYCTGNHWLFQNMAELQRIQSFQQRHGIYVSAERQVAAIYSDEVADYMTHFGTPFQLQLFDARPQKHLLDISAVYEPDFRPKNLDQARRNFLWLGSGGLVLKGLDLAVEAFIQTPDLHLYIAGHAERETRFWSWLKPLLDKHPNLHYLGWTDVGSQSFAELAHSCVGTVYVSSTEGGPGSVAQLAHFGLIPVVTETAAVRVAEAHGTVIRSQDPATIVAHTVAAVRELADLPAPQLHERTRQVHDFARQHHTRAAYAHTFQQLLHKIS